MAKEYIRRMIIGSPYWPYTVGGVLLEDDMEGIFSWVGSGTGAYTCEQSRTYRYKGDFSMHLKTRTSGAAAGDIVGARRTVCIIPTKKLMLSLFYYPVSGEDMDTLSFNLVHYDGTYRHQAACSYSYTDKVWSYLDSENTLVVISGSSQNLYPAAWHSLALTVDFATGNYGSFVSDGASFDLSGNSYYQEATTAQERLEIYFEIKTAGESPVETYYDYVRIDIV